MLIKIVNSRVSCNNLLQNGAIKNLLYNVRLCSTGSSKKLYDAPKNKEWEPIYFFRPIKIASAISNLKLLQAGITILGIPLCYTLENMAQIPSGATAICAAIGLSGTITLFIFAKVSATLVGFIYTNPTVDRVKISYIDFWGKRRNYETELSNIMPFSEIQKSKYNIYMPLKFYSGPQNFKLLHTFGEIYDFDKFDKVFGD